MDVIVQVDEVQEGVANQFDMEGRQVPIEGPADVPAETSLRLPRELIKLMRTHGQAYWEYAFLKLGDADAAEELVDDVFADLAAHWGIAVQQESLKHFCWKVLATTVDTALVERHRSKMLDRAMQEARGRFDTLESPSGLFDAIKQLPKRQYQAIILIHVLGYDGRKAAKAMGISECGVYSLNRDAKRRLSAILAME
ncbi:RNA polymerase sigma factor [Kitasatospora sp. NPDC059673]|uniref:RNA polymerase sigma factor n=1 Tax=Kitasatospora sp. NPDC059673 TaxID=3346901 RepID=UPI0036A8767C